MLDMYGDVRIDGNGKKFCKSHIQLVRLCYKVAIMDSILEIMKDNITVN